MKTAILALAIILAGCASTYDWSRDMTTLVANGYSPMSEPHDRLPSMYKIEGNVDYTIWRDDVGWKGNITVFNPKNTCIYYDTLFRQVNVREMLLQIECWKVRRGLVQRDTGYVNRRYK